MHPILEEKINSFAKAIDELESRAQLRINMMRYPEGRIFATHGGPECSECGKKVGSEDRFCRHCGAKFTENDYHMNHWN